ncbi:hypothetical protein [Streptomyces sp. NRRL B-24720]|uniref:hypothetical protein n=1 Tax=Streptomyces sp. NRRL B-24720 TaxID=1476876 RepID=UPI0004C8A5B3|nr:hypothetical protein [Streptomyces sp. NRRL B-24720]
MSTATRISPALSAAAFDDARTLLATAQATDIDDHVAVVASHEALAGILRRVLWTVDELDDEPDVAAQVAMEDGVRSIGVPYQRTTDGVTA